MPLEIQVWLYECCSSVPAKIASKVDNRILRLLNWKTIVPRPRFEFLMNVMFKDNGKDPPPRKINEHSKKKQKVDSSTPAAKKSLSKKQTHSSKMKKEKQIARVIFPQVHSKPDNYVEEVAVSKPQSHIKKEAFISKKDFYAFCDEVRREFKEIRGLMRKKFKKMKKTFAQSKEQVVDMEGDKSNVDEEGLQHFSPDVVQSLDNISDGTKRLSSEVDQELEASLLGTKGCTDLDLDYLHSDKVVQHDCRTCDEKIDETILSDLQFSILDEILPSLNAYRRQSIIIHPSANRQEESYHEIFYAKNSDTVIEIRLKGITDLSSKSLVHSEVELDTEEQVRTPPNTQEVKNDEQRVEQLWLDSQNTIPNEFLPSLNVYDQKSIMIHPSDNREVKTPRPKLRNMRPSKFKESPYTEKFGSAAERCIFLYDLYKSSSHYAVVLAEIEKIAKIIPLCLQGCDFYVKKGIDLQNHPRYRDKDSSDMFDVLFEDDLPQQPSESLDCGVFMVMYAECLSYGHKAIPTEFDPNTLRTRYAALLWDYGIRKKEANVISDVEEPLRPARQSRITSVTEVFDV
ncbi:hypothetical protein CQW23_31209 [Capsicum baccatum]|uniref:Ubiquitin-like protease family profile domain-containing protein n=1 Tax=Capsicum baccatum TaxID=33114 RepID=A0A2G2V891_CAPBA|nr:hypothetical protein CQW23_31209 [Capsicum baccatum]